MDSTDRTALEDFVLLRPEDEPIADDEFRSLPGNLKKSYLMMEILDDNLQRKIRRLRAKASPERTQNASVEPDLDGTMGSIGTKNRFSFDKSNTCISSSRKFVRTFRKIPRQERYLPEKPSRPGLGSTQLLLNNDSAERFNTVLPGPTLALASGRNSAESRGELDESKSPSAFRSPRASTLPKVPDALTGDKSKSQFPPLKATAVELPMSSPKRKFTMANAQLKKRETLAPSSMHDTLERQISHQATAYKVHEEVAQ